MRAEAPISDDVAASFHLRGVPKAAEVPIVIAKVVHALENFATRHGSLVIDHRARASGPALQLWPSLEGRLGNELVHVDVDRRLEESGIPGVIVLDGRMPRIL